MKIYEALSSIGYPVTHPPHEGDEKTYYTYQVIGQESTLYADGQEQETATRFAVDLFSDQPAAAVAAMIPTTKAALYAAGYLCRVDQEMYEYDTKLRHIAMTAWTVGAIYG